MLARLTLLYRDGRLDEAGLQAAVDRGWITPQQMADILAA